MGGEYLTVDLGRSDDGERLPECQFNDRICAQAINAAQNLRMLMLSPASV